MSDRRMDLVGVAFGRLTVIALAAAFVRGVHDARWLCRCACGTEKQIAQGVLRGGRARSCGCLRREVSRARATVNHRTHGLSKAQEYRAWINMKLRVMSPDDISYERYKRRGITIYEPWLTSFELFFAEIGPVPTGATERLTVDRIDNDRGYEPGNLRWATYTTQANNRSTSVYHEVGGRKMPVKQIAREYGFALATINSRLRLGWPIERCVAVPVKKQKNNARVEGESCATA